MRASVCARARARFIHVCEHARHDFSCQIFNYASVIDWLLLRCNGTRKLGHTHATLLGAFIWILTFVHFFLTGEENGTTYILPSSSLVLLYVLLHSDKKYGNAGSLSNRVKLFMSTFFFGGGRRILLRML